MVADHNLIDRRSFLATAGATFLLGLSEQNARAIERSDTIFASAYKAEDGYFGIAVLTERGDVLHQYQLPARGHDVVFHPDRRQLVAFARRPGTFAAVIDTVANTSPMIFYAPANRHFYGHGCFSEDGKLLYATENDFNHERGAIGIYDSQDGYRRIGEYSSFGIGPHEMVLAPDGRTLVIANGGIITHPDFPRAKLNIATMLPNIAFIDTQTGGLIAKVELPKQLHKLSIRHLAILDDQVWFACQNEGNIQDVQPLIGHVSIRNSDTRMLELPDDQYARLRGYVGSIAGNIAHNRLAFTSPRGGVAMEIDPVTGALVSASIEPEVCGIAPSASGFLTTSGVGAIADHGSELLWDNHIASNR